MASKWERSRDGRKTFKNSAENIPPFFMTLVFLMLSVAVRLGCLKRNSLILRKKMRSEHSYTHLYLWHYQLAQLFHKLRGHSLWGDVLRPAGPIPYPVCIFLQEPFYLSPPFKEVLFGLEQRAMIRQNTWLSEVGISPLKQICSAPKAAHEAAPAARFSHLSLLHTCPITPSIWTLDKCGQRGDGLRAGHEWQRAISHILICVIKTSLETKCQAPCISSQCGMGKYPTFTNIKTLGRIYFSGLPVFKSGWTLHPPAEP